MHLLEENVQLQPFNTFGVKATARWFASIEKKEDLQALLETNIYRNGPVFILGGGSDVLFTRDYDGLVAKIDIAGLQVIDQSPDTVRVHAGAGMGWHAFVLHCVEKGWGGVENLSLIPGKVGAAPIQNIGAYGSEVKDTVTAVHTIDARSGRTRVFAREACHFAYRDSYFKHEGAGGYIITGVDFLLTRRNHVLRTDYYALKDALQHFDPKELSIKAISDTVISIRRSKLPDPGDLGNAGSFFKNPVITTSHYEHLKRTFPMIPGYPSGSKHTKVPAAWLIEECGWKGKREGTAGVYARHALVLVNHGGDAGSAIMNLASRIQRSVKDKFDIDLQPEVVVL